MTLYENLLWCDEGTELSTGQRATIHYILPQKCADMVFGGVVTVGEGEEFLQYASCVGSGNEVADASSHNTQVEIGTLEWKPVKAGAYRFVIKSIAGEGTYLENVTISELTINVSDGATYVDKYSVAVTHKVTTTAAYADTLQWQEETGGTWADIEGANAEEYVIGTWTGELADDEETARANTNAIIPAYDRRFRCVATNEVGITVSAVQHVVHTEGNGTPTITEE